jgi:hypothetical protein
MIKIEKNSTNNIVLTLSEKTTLTNAYYLFEFTSDETKDTRYIIPTDISPNKIRYNEFEIIEPTNISLTVGTWKYRIFEQLSSTNTNTNGLNEVECGRVDVIGSTTAIPSVSYKKSKTPVFNG